MYCLPWQKLNKVDKILLILIVEDDEVDYLNVKRLLGKAFSSQKVETTWVRDPLEVDMSAELAAHDICFIDQNIGQVLGIDVIRRANEYGSLTPMVLLTGVDDQKIDKQASEYGASDYLTKNELTPELLNRVVRFSIAQKEHAKKLTKLAYTDGLTGLANRLKFDLSLSQALAVANRTKTFLALVIIDLDGFKGINDNYGHGAGDTVLIEVSKRLTAAVRDSDVVARLGGDEFAVIFTCCKQSSDFLELSNNLRQIFQQPISYEHQNLYCYASMGVSVYSPNEEVPDISSVIREADDALYQIKKQGKNNYLVFNPLMRERLEKSVFLQRKLSQAVENNEFHLNFQPKISVFDNKVSGVEVLLRWRTQEGEDVPPDLFIPIAERSGYILQIGRWVVEQSCKQMREWLDQGIEVPPIAVNISAMQLEEYGFTAHISEMLEKYQLNPTMLELEITETVLMESLDKVTPVMVALAKLGCCWSIDDFGTGYSSLSRINELPITKIKIDRSFIEQIETSKSCQKLCNSIISLASALDLTVVVEGLESQGQRMMLTLTPSDELQGYLFSKPLGPVALIDFLQKVQRSELLLPLKKI